MDDRRVTYTRVRDGKTQIVTRTVKAHGQSKTPLYRQWKAMVRRCESEKAHNYKWYGAKGIEVCPEWREDFLTFKSWAESNGYVHGLQLDRVDSDKDYCPSNCRYITTKANMRNRDLCWTNEFDARVVSYAQELGVTPYELIKEAVEAYLPTEDRG